METVGTILHYILLVLEVILIFNLLIVVHETGHFLAARWRGLVIEKFGIWFGKPLWAKTINGVQYSLGSIPFGGFVALPQMAPMEAAEGKSVNDRDSLPSVRPIDKIIVAFAGPLFSFALAIVFAVIVYAVKRPVSEQETSTTIGYVGQDSPAYKAGLRPGDRIIEVDGHKVKKFQGMTDSVVWYVVRSEGKTIPFLIERDGQQQTFYPEPLTQDSGGGWHRKNLRQVLIEPAYTPMVGKVLPGSPAAEAGLQDGDLITAVNGKKLLSISAFIDLEQESYGKAFELSIQRKSGPKTITLAPMPFKIGTVLDGSPAADAGLKSGDIVTGIEGAKPTKFEDLKTAVAAHLGQPVQLTVSRNGTEMPVAVTPRLPKGTKDARIGINPAYDTDGIGWDSYGQLTLVRESPLDQIRGSITGILNTISAVASPKSDIKLQHLGGPLSIGRTYFMLLQSEQGWRLALWFSVILNVNLALLNMLPIPVLDGGHITLALIEAVRRRPVNIRFLEVLQTACFLVIAGYMLYVSFYDVGDLAGGGGGSRKPRQQTGLGKRDGGLTRAVVSCAGCDCRSLKIRRVRFRF